ncbi:hypothetical protein FC19_GL001338 [Liquorilactobacillus aquaticus DSM 21051]|uniref:Uncharacterized protein n=1 Tax=Liquorilactobacillus aquaticus DSM 21051 TaxID=1423725 RepID=A0A0R2D788_9LACO|nr:hypothetical protein FC19_GL001338 [Liquorilactobacillus aquaticus DSM 21051]
MNIYLFCVLFVARFLNQIYHGNVLWGGIVRFTIMPSEDLNGTRKSGLPNLREGLIKILLFFE